MVKGEAAIRAVFESEGLKPYPWSNVAEYRYDWHDHPYHKVLYCVKGSITFHTGEGDIELSSGDRLDLPPRTRHSATVGPTGVTCLEAARRIR